MGPILESILTRSWLQRGVLAWCLLPLALVYRLLTFMHRTWYAIGLGQIERAPVPVWVVGNVVAGGVGKTPVVMALVEHLRRRGLQVGIVSRGHGRTNDQARSVVAGDAAQQVGDEPLLMAQRCGVPVAVARRRMDAVRALLHAHPHTQLIVSDDGLQHHAMWHEVALCVFDDRGVGNGWPLPAGPLREAWPRTPRPGSVQLVLQTAASSMTRIPGADGCYRAERRLAEVARNGHGQTRKLSDWNGRPVRAVAGIARPDRFFAMLEQQGLQLSARHALSDHANLSEFEQALGHLSSEESVLCTEKDAVKLWALHPEVWAVPLQLTLPEPLLSRIDGLIRPPLSLPHGQQTA